MDKEFLIWLAGFIDGEGCFYSRYREKKGYDLWLTITQYHDYGERILKDIHSRLEMGTVATKNSAKTAWCLRISNKKLLAELLPQLIPYMRVKQKRAIEFHNEVLARIS